MEDIQARNLRVGHTVEDWCRPCKSYRAHTVMVVSHDAKPLRVTCDTCGSQHNFRGRAPSVTTKPGRSEEAPAAEAEEDEEDEEDEGEDNNAPLSEDENEQRGGKYYLELGSKDKTSFFF